MNLTLVGALLLLAVWIVLAFVVHVGNGYVHLLYAAAMVLLTRRVLVGAPRFVS